MQQELKIKAVIGFNGKLEASSKLESVSQSFRNFYRQNSQLIGLHAMREVYRVPPGFVCGFEEYCDGEGGLL
jgi:hypothetical protein